MKRRDTFRRVFTFSGAIVAYMIGSGFATGQEILQFYTSFGVWRSIGAFAISFVLFTWLGCSVMEDGRNLKLKRPSEIFKYYCGEKVGIFYELFTTVFLYMIFVVMVSGAGAIMQEYYGIPRVAGCLFMAIVSLVTVLLGLKNIVNIIGNIGPVIIVAALSIGIANIIKNFDGLILAESIAPTLSMPKAAANWLLSGVLYVTFCSIVMVPFLAGMGAETVSKKESFFSGGLGGLLFTLGAFAINLGMLASLREVHHLQAPALAIGDILYPGLGIFYSVCIVLGIYTTAVPMLWIPCNNLAVEEKSKKFRYIAILGTGIACLGGQLPFSTLVNWIYPFSGYLGILLMICVLSKQIAKLFAERNVSDNRGGNFGYSGFLSNFAYASQFQGKKFSRKP